LFGALFVAFSAGIWTQPIAAASQQEQRVPVERQATAQKAVYVKNLVSKSATAETIETSGDAAAIEKLERARGLVAEAESDLAADRVAPADSKLNEAIALVNKEARRLSQGDVREAHLKKTYDRRFKAVTALLTAYERVAEEKNLSSATAAQVSTLTKKIEQAEKAASAGRLEEAKIILDEAYLATAGRLRGLREGDELTRSLKFETAAEEYDYEIDRNDSHIMLLQLALSQKKPAPSYVDRIENLKADAAKKRARAESMSAAGDYDSAIDALSKSTDSMLQAIRMGGLYIPG
jgi:hypothetical protein